MPVLDQAVVRQFSEFLDPDARLAENFHGGPGPERLVLFRPQVPAFPGFRVLSPGPAAPRGQLRPAQRHLAGGEQLAGPAGPCRLQAGRGRLPCQVDGGNQGRCPRTT